MEESRGGGKVENGGGMVAGGREARWEGWPGAMGGEVLGGKTEGGDL